MSPLHALALYTLAILAGALVGGALPLIGRMSRSDHLLAFSAGIMLGAAFFHMLPESVEGAGARSALPFVAVGFLGLFLLERFVLVHACAEPGPALERGLAAGEAAAHAHVHGDGAGCEVHTLGMAAFLGLSVHTLVDGFALGASSGKTELGLLVFLAILAHKIPNAFSLSAILRHEGYSRARADILPDVHRRHGARLSHGAALVLGLAGMWALRHVGGE